MLAVAFHSELSGDDRLHILFLEWVQDVLGRSVRG